MFGCGDRCVRIGVGIDFRGWKLMFNSKNDVTMNFRSRKCVRRCFELDLDGERVNRRRRGIIRFGRGGFTGGSFSGGHKSITITMVVVGRRRHCRHFVTSVSSGLRSGLRESCTVV